MDGQTDLQQKTNRKKKHMLTDGLTKRQNYMK